MAIRKNKGGRPSGPKTRCSGMWTEAKFNSFVASALRAASRRWKPLQDCLKHAKVRRGIYLCASCKEEVPWTIVEGGKRKRNVVVDHREPVVDPAKGHEGWDEYVERLFCEEQNFDALCLDCHDKKSNEERAVAAKRRANE